MTIGEFLAVKVWHLAALVGLLACAGFYSGSETALFCLSRGELFAMAREPRRLARMVPALMRHPGRVLTTVLLGTDTVHVLYFVLSALLVLDVQGNVEDGEFWAPVVTGATFLAMVVGGEVLPKALANVWPRPLATPAAPVLAALGWTLRPIQRLLTAVFIEPLTRLLAPARGRRAGLSAEELAALLTLSQKRGLIGQDESELLQEVLELTDLRAGDIMVPRVDMVARDVNASREELLGIVRERGITRIPLYEGDLDHVVGVVHAKRLLMDPAKSPRELLAPVRFVPEPAALERVLQQFRTTGSRLAIVVDEYGGTAGLITLEDVLEEIVGDIADAREAPRGPSVQQVGPAEWLVDGNLPIHEWVEAFPTDLTRARFTTVGGFVVSLLGHIPRVGQTAEYRNVTFTVEAMRRRRIALLRVRWREVAS